MSFYSEQNRSWVDDFRQLAEDMAAFAKTQGIELVPYKSPEVSLYRALPKRQQISVYRGLKAYFETMLLTHQAPKPLSVAASTEAMLTKLDVHYDRDFLSLLNNENVVEIYMIESLQVFRNLYFFTLTNYPLEEICTRPWFELWEREHQVTELLLKIVGLATDLKITGSMSVLMPAHEVRDHAARLRAGSVISPMTLVPLFEKSGSIYGYMTSYRINPTP